MTLIPRPDVHHEAHMLSLVTIGNGIPSRMQILFIGQTPVAAVIGDMAYRPSSHHRIMACTANGLGYHPDKSVMKAIRNWLGDSFAQATIKKPEWFYDLLNVRAEIVQAHLAMKALAGEQIW